MDEEPTPGLLRRSSGSGVGSNKAEPRQSLLEKAPTGGKRKKVSAAGCGETEGEKRSD